MKLQIRDGTGARVSKIVRDHVQGRLGLALGRFGERIERVLVRFSRVGGERHCSIEVGLRAATIRTEGLHDDALAAVDHAISRAVSSITRTLEREQALAKN